MRAATEAVFVARCFAVVGKISVIRWRSSDGQRVVARVSGSYCPAQVQGFVAMVIS